MNTDPTLTYTNRRPSIMPRWIWIKPGLTIDNALDIFWHCMTETDRLTFAICDEAQADFDEGITDRILSLLAPDWKPSIVDFADEIAALDEIARKIGAKAHIMTDADMAHTGPAWDEQAFAAGEELGTRCVISGGEVMELDGHLEARYEEQTDEYPF